MNDLADAALVQDQSELAALCRRWAGRPALALDTEFVRERTFYAQLALVQAHDGDDCALLDPLMLDLDPFCALLVDAGITKVLHGCGEDLDIFYRLAGAPVQNLFDTQIAWALVSPEGPVSYARLVAEHFDAEVGTGETRSDWLQRPLRARQLHYAAEDVRYLLPLHEKLSERLEKLGRTAWADEEFQRMTDPVRFRWEPESSWLRFGARWRMQPRQLEALRRLAEWREHEARERDMPRTFVVKDPQLLQIAQALPRTRQSLFETCDLHPRQKRVYADRLLTLVAEAMDVSESELPKPPPQPDTSREARTVMKQMSALVADRARELDIAQEVLAPKRLLKSLLHRHFARQPLPDELAGWRHAVITSELIALLDAWRDRNRKTRGKRS